MKAYATATSYLGVSAARSGAAPASNTHSTTAPTLIAAPRVRAAPDHRCCMGHQRDRRMSEGELRAQLGDPGRQDASRPSEVHAGQLRDGLLGVDVGDVEDIQPQRQL